MYIYKELYKGNHYTPYISKLMKEYLNNIKGNKIGIIDIETTGLSPETSHFILGCVGTFTDEGLLCTQYFAENLSEEKEILEKYLEDIRQMDLIVTYNGKKFDINFLKKRLEKLNIPHDKFPYNLDLYRLVKNHSSLKQFLPNLKQKTVENFMGLWQDRKDEITGQESVDFYNEYLVSRENKLRDLILLHNRDDVAQLSRLLPVLKKCDLAQGFFKEGFFTNHLQITSIVIKKDFLAISGIQYHPVSYISYGGFLNHFGDTDVHFSKDSKTFHIKVPLLIKEHLKIIDMEELHVPLEPFVTLSNFHNNLLAIQVDKTICYTEILTFTKVFVEKVYQEIKDINPS